jgi:hypothetical protein
MKQFQQDIEMKTLQQIRQTPVLNALNRIHILVINIHMRIITPLSRSNRVIRRRALRATKFISNSTQRNAQKYTLHTLVHSSMCTMCAEYVCINECIRIRGCIFTQNEKQFTF